MAFTKAEFDAVKIGDKLGVIDGPGQYPKDTTAKVVQKVEDRWGLHLVAEFDRDAPRPGAGRATVSGFTKVGIGWYKL